MIKNNTMISDDYLKCISKIKAKDLDISDMENLLVGIFQCGIELSKAYCEAVKKSKEEENILYNFNNNIWKYDKGYVDFVNCIAKVNDSEVDLGYIESKILKMLVKHKGNAVDRDMIIDKIWGDDAEIAYRTIDVHVSKLRRKLLLDDDLVSVRNVGYRLN